MMMKNNNAQQEMVGFVLIVLVVVVGMMVFLVFSLGNSEKKMDSVEVSNMLSVILDQTTDCNAHSTIRPDDVKELFKSCYENDRCSNLNVSACDYLNETISEILEDVMASEAEVVAYQLDFEIIDGDSRTGMLRVFEGNCSGGETQGAQQVLSEMAIGLIICKDRSFD